MAALVLFGLLVHPAVAQLPPTFPTGDQLKVAHGTEVVSLQSVVDTAKATVVHLVTDYCGITEANLKHLSTKADEFPDVNFIAILWFLGGSNSKQFQCPADRSDCTEDDPKGFLLAEVAAYLPTGSKVKVVQDIQKPWGSSGSSGGDACTDAVGADNCKAMTDAGFTCDDGDMKKNCQLSCKICTPAETTTTPKPAFTPPECSEYYCGAVWNQFGSTGELQVKWDMKEKIITYVPGGCLLGSVDPPSSPNGVPGPKLWDGDLKTKVDDAIKAVAEAAKCEGGVATSGAPAAPAVETETVPEPAPAPAPAPTPASTPGSAPAPDATSDKSSSNATTAQPAKAVAASSGLGLQASVFATLSIPVFALC